MTDSLWRKRQEPEALKLALEAYLCREMPAGTIIGDPKWWAPKIAMAVREALAQPAQSTPCGEPVAFYVQKALRRAYHLGQNYWADADSESYAANKRSDKHRQNFDELCEEALAYTTPPQRKPLTDAWIVDAIKEAGETSAPNTDFECFAWLVRKVEAAHGVKEQK